MTFETEINAFWVGIAIGAASIVSLGPNSAMILREGLARGRVTLVATTTCLSFLVLLSSSQILTGMLGSAGGSVRTALSWAGVALIAYQACRKLRLSLTLERCAGAAFEPDAVQCIRRVLTFVWTNPLTYLERLLIPAFVGQSFASVGAREDFVLGLMIMSSAGCLGYACVGKFMGVVIQHEQRLRVFDIASGIIMLFLALAASAKLVTGGI
ncbi:LysE family transporter [Starkeya sp. ORNL1]|uniref:LysE family transporter n=1 Tax=Starkeya sp. ORNL1 TaxID=2709380 RepID=UPI0014642075|nr:LysE family transporter [Starkeya sp. ORNL1]QJP13656.1 LysE family transporter [Starkeya sp. ORNL1]